MNPAPRVCHISTVHSGVEIRIVRKQLATLAKAGYEAHVIIAATDAEVREMRSMGIQAVALMPYRGSQWLRMIVHGARAFRRARKLRADVYHFHDPELIPYALGLKLLGHRVIMDVHEDFAGLIREKPWIQPFLRAFIARFAHGVERLAAGRFDAVVAAVPYLGDLFREHARRTVVVGNFPFVNELEPPDGEQPWRDRRDVAYVGSIARIRGIFELVQALPAAGVRLQLAGKFMSAAEQAEAKQLAGWSQVDDHGFVDRTAIRQILMTSFAGICTLHPISSHLIAEPIKLFEYMAAGLPVISANIPYYERIVREADCGICVDPTDANAIAEAIRYLRDHPEEAQRMGQNGRRSVLRRYNWDHEASKLVGLYRDLLAT